MRGLSPMTPSPVLLEGWRCLPKMPENGYSRRESRVGTPGNWVSEPPEEKENRNSGALDRPGQQILRIAEPTQRRRRGFSGAT